MARRFLTCIFLLSLLIQGCAQQMAQQSPPLATLAPTATIMSSSTAGTSSLSLPELFNKVSSSVVVIQTVEKKLSNKLNKGKAKLESVYGLGSGVLISADGKVLTAAHVVHSADVVSVKFQNGEQVAARVIGSAPAADVSLLQLETVPQGYMAAVLGDSDKVRVGERIMVIGAPYGLSKTMTAGYISGKMIPKDQNFGSQQMEVFQSDAAVNTGNSGGPMFNMQGEVIGVVSSILSRSGGFEGISFAITANTAKKLLLDQPSYWLGIDAVILSQVLAQVLNVPGESGILIQRIAEGSIGDQMSLKPGVIPITVAKQEIIAGGDIIVEILGVPVPSDPEKLKAYLDEVRKKFR